MKPQVSQLLGQAIKTRMTQNYIFKRKKPYSFSDPPLRRRQVPPSWRLRRGVTCRRTARFVMAFKSSCLVMQLIRSIEPSNINFADELETSNLEGTDQHLSIALLAFTPGRGKGKIIGQTQQRRSAYQPCLCSKGITVNLLTYLESTLTFPSNLDS